MTTFPFEKFWFVRPSTLTPATVSDPAWRPFLVTPPYPDYPCALPSGTGASAEVLRRFGGQGRPVPGFRFVVPRSALGPARRELRILALRSQHPFCIKGRAQVTGVLGTVVQGELQHLDRIV